MHAVAPLHVHVMPGSRTCRGHAQPTAWRFAISRKGASKAGGCSALSSAISRRGASRAVCTRSHRVTVIIELASGAGSARSSAINARLPGSAEGTRSAWRFAISRKGASKAGAGQRHARRAACAVLAGKHRADLGLAGRAALDLRAVLLAVGVAVVPVHVGRSRRCKRWCSTCIRGCGCCADIVAGII